MSKKMELNRFKGMLADGKLSRRQINKILASVGIATVSVPLTGNWARADTNLKVFTWAVYDTPELHPAYVEKYGTSPSVSVFADNDEAITKLQSGFESDISVPTSSEIGRLRNAGLLEPIDPSRIEAWGDLYQELTTIKGMVGDGKQWAVPWTWGNSSIVFRPDLAPEYSGPENHSWSILWDPKYSGRLSTSGAMQEAVLPTAVLIGIDDPFNMSDDDIERVRAKLVEQRELLRYYWSSDADIQQSMAAGELVATYAWNSSYTNLLKEGVDVEWMNPKEGILTWCDTQVLLNSRSASDDETYDYLNATLEPTVGKYMIEEFAFGSANKLAFDIADETLVKEYGYADPQSLIEGSKMFEMWDSSVLEKCIAMFEGVKAGID
ncbi:MAG: extracellular solute-binding protein [Dongiaceae bacterium]